MLRENSAVDLTICSSNEIHFPTLMAELHAALSFSSTYLRYQTRTVERVGEWTSEVHMSHTTLILCGYLEKQAAKKHTDKSYIYRSIK